MQTSILFIIKKVELQFDISRFPRWRWTNYCVEKSCGSWTKSEISTSVIIFTRFNKDTCTRKSSRKHPLLHANFTQSYFPVFLDKLANAIVIVSVWRRWLLWYCEGESYSICNNSIRIGKNLGSRRTEIEALINGVNSETFRGELCYFWHLTFLAVSFIFNFLIFHHLSQICNHWRCNIFFSKHLLNPEIFHLRRSNPIESSRVRRPKRTWLLNKPWK